MLKKITGLAKQSVNKVTKKLSVAGMAVAAFALSAIPAFAATPSTNPDLDTVTTQLTDGASSMKSNALIIIGVCITIFIVVFGIGWLMSIFKKKMSKAG